MRHLAISLLFLVSQALAKDVVKLEGIKIKGDNEAPQVMYVIPWQNPKGAERLYTPVTGSRMERLKPLDPYQFEREYQLHRDWQQQKNDIDLVVQ
ncbi:hypothetical protein HF888_06095 [Bermanella marisrubri]|uniref:Uncharacterized protein n=1 Tax=Bermanella marisrubri TaxID=207949 RepID=Q1N0P9_9GAMM|nr:hypothetical protein [Bermanella marisrubri]EAT11784.1 hypothetical protein RED65_05339 [Oceanobacter sp. RED65] [Bermanella marisrubri]QIZ83819.1 hypothetical protein HF888_06095 [Bermanella marisrubri]